MHAPYTLISRSLTSITRSKLVFLFVKHAFVLGCAGMVSSSCLLAFAAPSKSEPTKELFLKGKSVYEKQCAVCHGVTGGGDGQAATLLYPKSRNFNRNEFPQKLAHQNYLQQERQRRVLEYRLDLLRKSAR